MSSSVLPVLSTTPCTRGQCLNPNQYNTLTFNVARFLKSLSRVGQYLPGLAPRHALQHATQCRVSMLVLYKYHTVLVPMSRLGDFSRWQGCPCSLFMLRTVVALTFSWSLKTFMLTLLRMRNKCKIINVQRNNNIFGINATSCSLNFL